MFIYNLSIFLTSTAFVDTKAKHILIELNNSQIYDINNYKNLISRLNRNQIFTTIWVNVQKHSGKQVNL